MGLLTQYIISFLFLPQFKSYEIVHGIKKKLRTGTEGKLKYFYLYCLINECNINESFYCLLPFVLKRVCRYQRGNQNSYLLVQKCQDVIMET